jgi:hypothetical protein
MDAREQKRREDFDLAHIYDPHHVPTTIIGQWAHTMAKPYDFGATRPSYGGGAAGGQVRSGGGAAGGGILDGLVELTDWLIRHVWPLNWLMKLGARLADTGWNWKLNIPLALLGGLFLPELIAGPDGLWPGAAHLAGEIAGGHATLALFGAGALSGWVLIPLVGMLVVLTIGLIGFALSLALVAGLLYLGWLVLSAWMEGRLALDPAELSRPELSAVQDAPNRYDRVSVQSHAPQVVGSVIPTTRT